MQREDCSCASSSWFACVETKIASSRVWGCGSVSCRRLGAVQFLHPDLVETRKADSVVDGTEAEAVAAAMPLAATPPEQELTLSC